MKKEGAVENQQEYKIEFCGLTTEQILEMNPSQLADFFTELDNKEELGKFLESASENDALMAQFSYWEKWLEKKQQGLIDQIVAKKRAIYDEGKENSESLPLGLEKKFTEDELSFIFRYLGAIQLTFGCSKGCAFCGFDAVPGVREHISYSQLVNLFQKYGDELAHSRPLLYWASEPSDYASKEGIEDRTYEDIHELAIMYANYNPQITSKEREDKLWKKFIASPAVSRVRISTFGASEDEIEMLQKSFGEKVKFTGTGLQHIVGIGVSSRRKEREDGLFYAGIGCINGLLMTPRGLYSVAQTIISEKFPQGQAVVPFEGISDEEIKVGDNLQEVIRTSVICSDLHNFLHYHNPGKRINFYHKDEVPNNLFVARKNKRYKVWFNSDGVIERVEDCSNETNYILEKNFKQLTMEGLISGHLKYDGTSPSEAEMKAIEEEIKNLNFNDIIIKKPDGNKISCYAKLRTTDSDGKRFCLHFLYSIEYDKILDPSIFHP